MANRTFSSNQASPVGMQIAIQRQPSSEGACENTQDVPADADQNNLGLETHISDPSKKEWDD